LHLSGLASHEGLSQGERVVDPSRATDTQQRRTMHTLVPVPTGATACGLLWSSSGGHAGSRHDGQAAADARERTASGGDESVRSDRGRHGTGSSPRSCGGRCASSGEGAAAAASGGLQGEPVSCADGWSRRPYSGMTLVASTSPLQTGQCVRPSGGANQRYRHGQQYICPHSVTTGSVATSKQMLHSNAPYASVAASTAWSTALRPNHKPRGPLRHVMAPHSSGCWWRGGRMAHVDGCMPCTRSAVAPAAGVRGLGRRDGLLAHLMWAPLLSAPVPRRANAAASVVVRSSPRAPSCSAWRSATVDTACAPPRTHGQPTRGRHLHRRGVGVTTYVTRCAASLPRLWRRSCGALSPRRQRQPEEGDFSSA
jgi:hypothetical protein